jgi:hypothetical protein
VSANVRHSSASNEHFTPLQYIEAARTVLGGIDLDPASNALGNTVVKAGAYYDVEANGFTKSWDGRGPQRGKPTRVFCNPPGGRVEIDGKPVSSQKAWWFKLASEYAAGRVSAAVFVSFSIELLQTCQVKPPPGLALPFDFPICFPARRIAYYREATIGGARNRQSALVGSSSPPHSSMLVYLPPRATAPGSRVLGIRRFVETFSVFGRVVVPNEKVTP